MRIGLIDVDGHNFPNLALMKLSAYHKQQGDSVSWADGLLEYDKVYMSKIFDDSADYTSVIKADEIIRGGRAYDKKVKLPNEIESMCPDYTLYGITDTAYGYLTRGCPRACSFCDVVNIEGRNSHKVADLSQFWNGQKYIKLLDPNLLACKDHANLLEQLIDSKAYIDITQGFDIRLINDKNIDLIKQMKIKMIHFAWDNPNDDLVGKFKEFKETTQIDRRKLVVYVLVNYNSAMEQDLYRIYALRDLGYDPFVMVYKDNGKAVSQETINLARWVNKKITFRLFDNFKQYDVHYRSRKVNVDGQGNIV